MHELSICNSLVSQVTKVAQSHHASAVTHIYLNVGLLSGVEPQLLQQAFPFASAETLADNAELHISMEPLEVRCLECFQTSKVTMQNLSCSHCQSWKTQLLSGDELTLARVELKIDED